MNGIDNRRIVSHWDERRQRTAMPVAAIEAHRVAGLLAMNTRCTIVLAFIRKAYRASGNFPTMRDIAKACGLSSTSMAKTCLGVLEQRNVIVRVGGKYSTYTLPEVLEALKSL